MTNKVYKTTNDNFLDENFVQFKIHSKNDSPKGNSQGNNDRSDKTDLQHKTSKENLSKFIMITQQKRIHLMNTVMLSLSISVLSVLLLTPQICLS